MLSLIMAILIAESRAAAKEHKLSEIIFSGCFGTAMVLVLYGITYAVIKLLWEKMNSHISFALRTEDVMIKDQWLQ